jgi:ABC-type multidrug transport system ATPase subunit
MGSSGAGKTTLLDVLAGRKNTGIVSGGMFVNGKPKDENTFRRIMGYVEQFDSLSPHDTAREAVEFSAALRLPGDTPADVRANWVTSVLTLLELIPLEHTMIGNADSGGMSFEQKKLVSIAVELAANPAILFLDEPTSGLDSRAAQVVIRCIRRVASSGRSIVCTIHQPSAAIFDSFDSLLLLRRGGQTVYFGELGERSSKLIAYMEGIPGVIPKPAGYNPATWMLEVIGAGTNANATTVDFHAYYKQSSLCEINTTHVEVLCPDAVDDPQPPLDAEGVEFTLVPSFFQTEATRRKARKVPLRKYNASYATQFRFLMYRFLLAYWRSPTYNFVRMVVSVVIALIFSSTYANQQYTNDVDVIARVALIYITTMFMGVVGMMTVQPVIFAERPGFYREQFSEIYDVKLYTLAATLVEVCPSDRSMPQ